MAITRITSPAITSVASTTITGTLPAANINNTSIGNVTALPAGVGGKVLQVVRTYNADSGHILTTSTSFTATGVQATITPTASSNLILVDFTCSMSAIDGSGNDLTGKMYQKIGSGSFAPMANAGFYQLAFTRYSQSIYAPLAFGGSYTTTNTDTLIFEPYIKSEISGEAARLVHTGGSYSLTVMEIAG